MNCMQMCLHTHLVYKSGVLVGMGRSLYANMLFTECVCMSLFMGGWMFMFLYGYINECMDVFVIMCVCMWIRSYICCQGRNWFVCVHLQTQ